MNEHIRYFEKQLKKLDYSLYHADRRNNEKEVRDIRCRMEHFRAAIRAFRALEEAEGKVDAAARTAKHYKEQRDLAVKQLRKIADCGTCRKDRPEGVDGPECVACTRGQNWEWNGGKA